MRYVIKNLHVIHERQLHAQQVTVWCALWPAGIIDLTFLIINFGTKSTILIGRHVVLAKWRNFSDDQI